MKVAEAVGQTIDGLIDHLARVGIGSEADTCVDCRRDPRSYYDGRVESVADFEGRAGKNRSVERQRARYVDFVGSSSGPCVAPDIVDAAGECNHIKTVVGELDLEAWRSEEH